MFTTHAMFTRPRVRWKRPRRWAKRTPFRLVLSCLAFSLKVEYQPACGFFPLAAFRGRGALGRPYREWPQGGLLLKRKAPNAAAAGDVPVHLAAVESNVFSSLPNLVSHCAVTRYDDGSARRPGWFTVKTMGASWVVQVKDPDGCCAMNLTAASLDDALALADVMLGADDAPWEADPFLKNLASGKKK